MQAAAMRKSIAVYRALADVHSRKIEQLRLRRRSATDSTMVEIDDRLLEQERLIMSLNRAIEATELQVQALLNSQKT
jgi:hypothetical protein